MSNQLIKTTELGKENVFPRTRILDLFDDTSGLKLIDILRSFNMMFVPYLGNKSYTRNQISPELRRQGLWLTYVIDNTVYTEWYGEVAIDDTNWGSDSNWRQGSNALVGDLSVSPNGTWVINGEDSGITIKGDKGDSPVIRIYNNKILVSYDNGVTYEDLNNTPIYTTFRTNDNRLLVSTDLGTTWKNCSEPIAALFRWANADGTGNIGKVLISRDLLNWEDLSPIMINNLYIKGYVSTIGNLPSSANIGDIYMVGPTYDESDTTHDYPHYRMWVKLSSGWVDNGEYLSNVLISLTTGLETGITMSLKAITNIIAAEQERAEAAEQANATAINTQDQKLSELEWKVGREDVLIDFNVEPSATFISDVYIIGGKEYTIKVDENNGASVMLLLSVSDYVRINSGTTIKHTFAGSGQLRVYNSILSVISGTVSVSGFGIVSKLQKLSLSITDLSNEISDIKEDVNGINDVLIGSSHTYDNADDFAGKGYIDSKGALQNGGKNGTFELKVGDAVHGKINVSSAMYLARVNDDGTYTPVLRVTTGSFGWYEFDYKAPSNMTLLVPTWTMGSGEDAAYVTISNKPKYTYAEFQNEVESLIEDSGRLVYVDGINGNDSNDGSLSFPLKSLVAALAKGNNIIMLSGEYTYPDETLFKMNGKKFSLKGKCGASVIIRCGSNLGKPTKNGNQYEINAPADVTSWANNTFDRFPLYIDGLKDKEIPADELHPCQKGHTHRLPSTRLFKVGDSRADGYTWEYTNGKIVINAPVDITSYDIWRPVYGIDQRCRNSVIELENFELRYNSLGLTNSHCVAKDISILHSCNNEFGLQYDYSYLYAERVEVGGTAMKRSSELDGIYYNMCDSFQGHGGGRAYASRNDASAILIDCWAHDSDDDTCSDHGSWDTTIIGGLYEYANKGCIMPSNGQRCKVIGATARKGRYGFVSCNQVDGNPLLDNIKQGMYLVSCVAEKCTETGYCSYSKHAVMYLVNCLSKNNPIGYKNKSDAYADEGTMILENCKSFGDTTKSSGTITKNNYQDL